MEAQREDLCPQGRLEQMPIPKDKFQVMGRINVVLS